MTSVIVDTSTFLFTGESTAKTLCMNEDDIDGERVYRETARMTTSVHAFWSETHPVGPKGGLKVPAGVL